MNTLTVDYKFITTLRNYFSALLSPTKEEEAISLYLNLLIAKDAIKSMISAEYSLDTEKLTEGLKKALIRLKEITPPDVAADAETEAEFG